MVWRFCLLAHLAVLGISEAPSSASQLATKELLPCPEETTEKSFQYPPPVQVSSLVPSDLTPAQIEFENASPLDVQLAWVSQTNQEQHVAYISPGMSYREETYVGHLFNVRTAGAGRLLVAHRVKNDAEQCNDDPGAAAMARNSFGLSITGCEDAVEHCTSPSMGIVFFHVCCKTCNPGGTSNHVVIRACADVDSKDFGTDLDDSRWVEFEHLARDSESPCTGPSANWSCVRAVSEDLLARRDSKEYGFLEGECKDKCPYKVGTTTDHLWMSQQKRILNVTSYEKGFLKMEITEKMRSTLYPWYEDRKQGGAMRKHERIPGYFTNSHAVQMDKIDLERDLNVRYAIAKEIRQVLQWWTRMPLRHSTTFGLRIYRRGSMVINHLDRADTHIASAVVHVGSQLDEGWPLEIVHPHKPERMEVYLRPGEMLLYEGARIVHGRPMRFKGSEFSNILSHFKPVMWKGPTSWKNPLFKGGDSSKGSVSGEL